MTDSTKAPGRFPRWLITTLALCAAYPALAQNATLQDLPRHGPEPVKEQMFVPIGGIEQWITIKGNNPSNPVILFLHGGPGDALSPFADAMYAGWEKDFTLVQWDQRGAGRTYTRNDPSIAPTMTMDRMMNDGIEVAEFLTKHLHKQKLILEGGSWGSFLGIYMAHTRPDLFYAYVGSAQLVNWQQNLSVSYARMIEMARSSNDQQAVAAFASIGPPPWHSVSKWPIFRRWERAYQARLVTAPPPPLQRSPEYASPEEQAAYAAADDFSFLHWWGMELSGPLTKIDLPAIGADFAIPIFIVQGEQDLTAVPELAKTYFNSIKAPHKQFYLVPGTGHEGSAAELDLIRNVLLKEIRPMALSSAVPYVGRPAHAR